MLIFSLNKEHIKVIFVGSTGTRKSFLCNKVVEKKIFEEGNNLTGMTFRPQSYSLEWPGSSNFPVMIIDTPGFGDYRFDSEEVLPLSSVFGKLVTL